MSSICLLSSIIKCSLVVFLFNLTMYIFFMTVLNEQLEARNISYDLLKSRVAELESIIIDKDASLKEQNRLVDEVRTDYVEQLKVC